jgi:hypothetical protein
VIVVEIVGRVLSIEREKKGRKEIKPKIQHEKKE